MNNLFLLFDNLTKGHVTFLLNIIYIISILCAIFVIINKNPIISVLFLIFLFLNISVYLILLGINFIAFSYILVYVGAISMLFLFILMLMNIRVSELSNDTTNSIPLGIILFITFYNFLPINIKEPFLFKDNSTNLEYATSFTWESSLIQSSHINTVGNIIYTDYFMWLIISSIILLLAMVGSIIITIRQTS